MKSGAAETYQERAERRRRTRGTGEARGDGWQRTGASIHSIAVSHHPPGSAPAKGALPFGP
ncbi:hypothetical protein ACH4FA_36605 [Streptomyces sp. NPDC017966]|uniref:hypothetical protein n=1 Tax=Streptomyces sp. NPDC017966 TaxID=3365023 RepID=UPI0037B81F18